MKHLQIETKSKQYPVFIGPKLRHEVGERIKELNMGAISSILIITDDKVAPLYLEDVKTSLTSFQAVFEYIIPSGESSKSFQQYYDIQSHALESGLDRRSLIIALGGGVVGDLAGFVAATYMRGIPFIQVPTTLLAHDSSVGGKVAINHPLGKNMIGSFHQPDAVLYDIDTLQSLPNHEWRSGFAEVMKHALIWDKQLYVWLKENIQSLQDINGELAEQLLKRSISVKAAVVKEDETEKGIRAFLNFGHTLGHAIETELGYGKITHGEAVVIGIIFAMKVSEEVFSIQLPIAEVRAWAKKYGFDTEVPAHLPGEKLIETMKKDKKSQHGVIHMVLQREIGKVEVVAVEEDVLRKLL
jgi:3-dehydroquinate synthase